jgi:hypothetical protein
MPEHALHETLRFAELMFNELGDEALTIAERQLNTATDDHIETIWLIIAGQIQLLMP